MNQTKLIIKIGGSSLTDKSQLETLDEHLISWFSSTIAKTINNSNDNPPIIIHGAGSFGHFHAKKFHLRSIDPRQQQQQSSSTTATTNGNTTTTITAEGLSQTRLSVQKLHLALLTSLHSHGIHAMGVSPLSFPTPDRLVDNVEMLLERGLTPVIHGDVYLNPVGILGGDQLAEWIAGGLLLLSSSFSSSSSGEEGDVDVVRHDNTDKMVTTTTTTPTVRVVFVTDVEGVFTADPKVVKDAELIREIDAATGRAAVVVGNDENHLSSSSLSSSGKKKMEVGSSQHEHDVTGGLEGKLRSAMAIAKKGVEVLIVKAGSLSAEQAFQGERHVDRGTLIRLGSSRP